MFSWTSGLQNPLIENDFNMFLDEWTSVKVQPALPQLIVCLW